MNTNPNHPNHSGPVAPRVRRGMTLMEVMIAMVLLTSVILALGGFTAKFAQASSQARLTIGANELAGLTLDKVRTAPTYSSIDLLADSVKVTRDLTDYTVVTKVRRVGGSPADSMDYRLMTVTVTHPALKKKVYKTTAVAVF
jgi:prepilin-type N-terminal cleavage/methylation domain-containing protein